MLRLCFFRRFRLLCAVECDCLKKERFKRSVIHGFPFMNVNGASRIAIQAGIEQMCRVIQRCTLGE
ncbi:MAG: hypothetical protein RLZ68_333, partial [Pseudomonadota bacterium]